MSRYCDPLSEHHDRDYGAVMTVEEFKDAVRDGMLIDYDGFAYPVKDEMVDPGSKIWPSRMDRLPADATHVIWYNR